MEPPQPQSPHVKGVFPLMKASFRTFNSPHEWLEAILDNESTQINGSFIEQVVHYTKENEHEFLVLQVGLIDSLQKACVIVERVQFQGKMDRLALSTLSSSPLSLSCDLPVADVITCAYLNSEGYRELARHRRLKDGCKPIRKLTFDAYAARPSILQFATLVKVTSSHVPSYNRHQCYWFATTVVEALMKLFPIALRSVEPPRMSGTYRHMNVLIVDCVSQVCDEYREGLRAVSNRMAEVETRWQHAIELHQVDYDQAHAEGRAEERVTGRASLSLKGVFPSTKTDILAFNSPHAWLETILGNESTQLNRCFVEQVVHYKCTAGNEHEFLVLQVGLADGLQKACIIAERTVQIRDKADKLSLLSNSPSSPSHGSSFALPFRDLPAIDAIRCAYLHSNGYQGLLRQLGLKTLDTGSECKSVGKLTFDPCETRLPILQLATLIMVTSSHAPSYSLYQHQCYWFAATVVKALANLFPTALRSLESPRQNGMYSSLYVPMADSVSQVCDEYREKWKVVCGEIAAMEGKREERQQQTQMCQADLDKARAEGRAEERAENRATVAALEMEVARLQEQLKARDQVQVLN